MDKTKILAIVPYRGMADLMKSVAEERTDISLTVEIGDLEEGLEFINGQDLSSYDIVVSRGGTAQLIALQSTLPVVEVEISMYDILRAIRLGSNFQGKLAIVGYPNITKCAHMLCSLLQYDIEIHTIQGFAATKACIQSLKARGYQHILCDAVSQRAAIELGVNAILITSGVESIEEAFCNAVKFHTYLKKPYFWLETSILKDILSHSNQYVLVYDQQKDPIFSTLKDYAYEAILAEVIQAPIAALLAGDITVWEHIWKKQHLKLSKQEIVIDGITYSVIIVLARPIPNKSTKLKVQMTNAAELPIDDSYFHTITYLGELASTVERYSNASRPLLICGEAGCGKSVVAKMLYQKSSFRKKPLYTIDFTIPQNQNIAGLIKNISSALNDTGRVIYFKHLESLPLAKLKQCLAYIDESGQLLRNQLLLSLQVADEHYASDTYFKMIIGALDSFTLYLKPLRSRSSEIPILCNLYINRLNVEFGKQIIGLEPKALQLLQDYSWPNNLTQMEQILSELIFLSDSPYISANDVMNLLPRKGSPLFPSGKTVAVDFSKTLSEISADIAFCVLEEEHMNQTRAAQRLGISRSTLWRIMKERKR